MAKKSGKQTALDDEQSQPLLEDDSRETEMIPVDEAELEPELAEDDDAAQRKPKKLADEPLFAALLRRAVKKHWGDDGTLLDFCDCVAGPLSAQLGHVGAKGGKFAAELAQAGKDVERFSRDQSLRAHLINGLFPVLRIARRLKGWGAPQFRRYDARAERVFMASYLLHDWVKLPSAQSAMQAAGLNHDTVNPAKDLQFMRQTFTNLCAELGIDKFLQPVGGVGEVLEDLIAIASNTQLRWGTNRNPSAFPNLVLDGPTRDLCEQLSRMADYITYLARTPREVARHDGLHQTLVQLSDGKARLVSHHVTEVRGILTNLIHNAAMEAMTNKCREPLLFAPSGVVYLEWEGAPPLPEIEQIAEDTIETIKRTSKKQIIRYGVGTSFDNKGIKFADYYKEILNFDEYVKVTCEIVSLRIKNSHVKDRYKSMIKKAFVSAAELCDMPEDVQVDSLAAWFRTCSMNLVDTISEIDERLLSFLNFTDDIKRIFNRIPQSDGGMGLRWFFAAGQYRKCHPGLDPEAWRGQMAGIADALANAIGPVPLTQDDPWADTRDYIQRALHFVDGAAQAANLEQNVFLRELGNYTNAKCGGRGVSIASSISSSPYESREQRETSVLFAPQVYTSKLPLHGSKAIRGIDPISAKEMMLRQLFMNRTNAIGGKFEGQKIRYLYFYPVYFFSLETMKVFDELYDRLQGLSLTELKRQLVNETATPPALKLDENTLQRLEEMMLTEPGDKTGSSRVLRMEFSDDMPITFYFLGLPNGRDPTDTESWVKPALLALLLPLCVDVKVVASESVMPLLNEGDEMGETVLLDSPHAFVQHVLGEERINVDAIYPILRKLLVAYFIHIDANSKLGGSGFDYAWARLPALARDVSQSAAYASYYLKKWQRKEKKEALPENKARLYIQYTRELEPKGGKVMAIATELVTRYRKFYRAKKHNSNSILRPVSIVSKFVLDADPVAHPDAESLVLVARAGLADFMERVGKGMADGRFPKGVSREERETAMKDFAEYFVQHVFLEVFRGDRAALRGKQLNLIKSACEVVYHDLEAQDRAAQGQTQTADDDEDEGEAE